MPCSFRLDRSKITGIGNLGTDLGEGCQFSVPEEELRGAGQNQLCCFHLPLGQERKSEIALDWFNEQIFGFVNIAKNEGRIVDLSGVHFLGPISFDGFTGDLNSLPDILCVQAHFGGETSFRGTNFAGLAVFSSAVFHEKLVFDKATFNGAAEFDHSRFSQEANFVRVTFGDRTNFQASRWAGSAIFNRTRFAKHVVFDDTEFHNSAYFAGTTFSEKAFFVRSVFAGKANFIESKFDQNANFEETSFSGPLRCDGAIFRGHALFRSMRERTMPERALPSGLTAHNRIHGADFHNAAFGGRADFSNRSFISRTDFRRTVFEVAPEFYGSELHQDTDFSGAEFRDHKGSDEVNAARAYRTLKLAMEQTRATREQAKFFRHEQRSLRLRSDTPRSLKAISWLYEVTSDYGESPIRPLVGVGAAFAAFFLVYLAIQTSGKAHICWAEIEATLFFTARQVFMPFRIFIGNPQPSLGLAFLAAAHSLLNISFIALFIIALRRKFRLV